MGLALRGNEWCVNPSNGIVPLGVLFASTGTAYRELTIHYSDIPDHFDLPEGPAQYTVPMFVRGWMVRFFFVIPIAAWASSVCDWGFLWSFYFALALLITLLLQWHEFVRRSCKHI